jgi:hypothetical protein
VAHRLEKKVGLETSGGTVGFATSKGGKIISKGLLEVVTLYLSSRNCEL